MSADNTLPASALNPPGVQRLDYLDAARGIAALMVFFGHYLKWRLGDRPVIQWLCILGNPHDAVSFFFVLSGFVLSYKYIVLNQPLDIGRYTVSRFFRLYPGFVIAVIANALFWFHQELNGKLLKELFLLNKHGLWEELFLLRHRAKYYVPGWTLAVEMGMSLLLPFLLVVAKKDRRYLYVLLPLILLVSSQTISVFFFHFVLGMIISCLFGYLHSEAFRQTGWYRHRGWVLAAAVVLFSLRQLAENVPFRWPAYRSLSEFLTIGYSQYSALASFVFIVALLLSRKAQRVLQLPVLRFLGRISYGIYLCHWTFVWATYKYWDQLSARIGGELKTFVVMMIVCLAATLVSATMMYYWVEQPFIRLGRKVAARLKPGLSVA